MIKFDKEPTDEITSFSYKNDNGKIALKFKYKTKPRGFLVCVGDVFSEALEFKDYNCLSAIESILRKTGNYCKYSEGKYEYQLFYVTEQFVRSMNGVIYLPDSVKSPVSIWMYWLEGENVLHKENSQKNTIIIPIDIIVETKKRSQGFIRKQYYKDIRVNCTNPAYITDTIMYYRVNGKNLVFPMGEDVIKNGTMITLKLENENTDISYEIFPEYRQLYRLHVYNN